ncbi:MAG: hypothetical protein ACD_7C00437G0005, partial [uncultured bacterium]
ISSKKDENVKYTYCGSNEIIAGGKMELNDLENLFDVKIETSSNAVTVGGFLMDELGEIPAAGDKINRGSLLFYVLSSDPNRVKKVYIRLAAAAKRRKNK